jgi:hypothetical protein
MDINKRNRNDLKSYFKKNSIPTEGQFAELIDGMLNQKDDGIARLSPAEPLSIQAAADAAGLKQAINFFGSFQDPGPAWTLLLNPHTDPANPATAKAGFCISDGQGVNRLFIDSITGNVGIGTANPKYKLTVEGPWNAGKDPDSGLSNGGVMAIKSWSPQIDFIDTDYYDWAIHVNSGKMYFIREPWEINMVLDGFGNVGIGTETPQAKLDIEGGALLGYETSQTNFGIPLKSGFYQGVDPIVGDIPDTSSVLTHLIVARHNNTNNNYQLQIASTFSSSDRLFFRKIDGNDLNPKNPSWNELATRGSNSFSGNQQFLGAIIPSYGSTETTGIMFPKDPGGGGGDAAWIRYYSRYPTDADVGKKEQMTLEIGVSDNANDHIALMPSGNVGIGTNSPSHKFHVLAQDAVGLFESSGTQAFLRLSTNEGLDNRVEITNRPGGILTLWCAGGGDVFNLTKAGNVGIGTPTPNAKLHVIGDTLISGGITVGAGADNVVKTRHVKGKLSGQDGDDNLWLNYDSGKDVIIGGNPNVSNLSGLTVAGSVNIGVNLNVTGTASIPGGAWTNSSDERLKQNIHPLDGALDKLLRLRGMEFEWKEPEKQGNLTGPQMGLVAQEVETVFPEWVGVDGQGYRTLTIRGFEALAIEAIKELKAENESLKKRCEELEAKL